MRHLWISWCHALGFWVALYKCGDYDYDDYDHCMLLQYPICRRMVLRYLIVSIKTVSSPSSFQFSTTFCWKSLFDEAFPFLEDLCLCLCNPLLLENWENLENGIIYYWSSVCMPLLTLLCLLFVLFCQHAFFKSVWYRFKVMFWSLLTTVNLIKTRILFALAAASVHCLDDLPSSCIITYKSFPPRLSHSPVTREQN